MKEKVRNSIIIVGIILVIAIIVLLLNTNFIKLQKLKKINEENKMNSEMPIPENLYLIMAIYNGDLTTEIISKTYNNFAVNVLPKYYKACNEKSSEEIKKYFNKNKNSIYIELGYENETEFESFINSLKKLEGEKLEFESYRILQKTVEKSYNNVNAYIAIKYKNNNEIFFNSHISDRILKECISIKMYTDINENIIEEDKVLVEEQKKQLENEKSPFTRRYSY